MSVQVRCLAILWALSLPVMVRADRDIVYGARYYAPPHSKIQTHFHIYRINPDGTKKTQLTFGKHDDNEPFWAPDGKSIVFFRDNQFSIISAKGGAVTALPIKIDYATRGDLHWSPDGRTLAVVGDGTRPFVYFIDTHTHTIRTLGGTASYQWSPDGTKRFIQNADDASAIVGNGAKTEILLSNKKDKVSDIVWLDPETLFGIRTTEDDKITPFTYQIASKREQRLSFKMASTLSPADGGTDDPNEMRPVYLMPIPSNTRSVLYAWNQHNSTVGINNDFYRVNTQTGLMTLITEGKQFLTFSPDGSRFCTAPGRDTSNYEKRRFPLAGEDKDTPQYRTVWTAPLQIGETKTGKVHTISKGLVWVVGGDWLKPSRKKIP